nr:Embryo defective 2759 isoform 2 [Ipomoea batatas]
MELDEEEAFKDSDSTASVGGAWLSIGDCLKWSYAFAVTKKNSSNLNIVQEGIKQARDRSRETRISSMFPHPSFPADHIHECNHSKERYVVCSGGAPLFLKPKAKVLKILAFKSSSQNNSGGSSGSKTKKESIKLSIVSQGNEETSVESPRAQNLPISYTSETVDTTSGTLAIQKIFKHWLAILRTPSPDQAIGETVEGPSSTEAVEPQNLVQQKERGNILQAVWSYFVGLDATIKINLLIFVPFYLAVNLVYGAEVSKELMPLWILGPFVVALYIKMLQGICALYVFCFKQTVRVVKNFPTYYMLANEYIVQGKLKEEIRARFLQPVLDIKNIDYKEVAKSRMEDLKVILAEKYLDLAESIWPYYCRAIRTLKRANLI